MKRAKLQDVEFTIISDESISESADITDNPVESGQDVSDHVNQKPSILSLTGITVGSDSSTQFMKLKAYKEEGKLLRYIGRESHGNAVIQNINRNYDVSNATGFGFDMSLKLVRISVAQKFGINKSAPKSTSTHSKNNARGRDYMLQGDKGDDVKALQKDLNRLGYNIATDGSYGPATKRAVTQFQKKYKLKIDGSAGIQVFGKIESLSNSPTAKKKVGAKTSKVTNKGKQQPKTKR